jgi:hypothetical protein
VVWDQDETLSKLPHAMAPVISTRFRNELFIFVSDFDYLNDFFCQLLLTLNYNINAGCMNLT